MVQRSHKPENWKLEDKYLLLKLSIMPWVAICQKKFDKFTKKLPVGKK